MTFAWATSSTSNQDRRSVVLVGCFCLNRYNFSQGVYYFGECERDTDAWGRKCADVDTDSDNDGWPDCCDNCPLVPNADQASELDEDYFGDACDLCPHVFDDGRDDDGDGVGNACDNCNSPGLEPFSTIGTYQGYYGCVKDSDCDCAPHDKGCRPAVCRLDDTGVGVCSRQRLSDVDGDGLGYPCDPCDGLQSSTNIDHLANSNDTAELREQLAILGDTCEPVPNFVSRPIVPEYDIVPPTDVPGEPSPYNTVGMYSTAQIGADVNTGKQLSYTGPVGFRHCSCFRPINFGATIQVLSKDECVKGQCSWETREYGKSPGDTDWKRVTVAVGDIGGEVLPFSSNLPRGAEVQDVDFTGTVHESDYFSHWNADEQETWRMGEPWKVAWRWLDDLAGGPSGGHVQHYDLSGRRGTLVHQWQRTGVYERFEFTALEPGSFLLSGVRAKGGTQVFHLRTDGQTLEWLGEHVEEGQLEQSPLYTRHGVYLPLQRDLHQYLSRVTPAEFRPLRRRVESL